MRPNKFWHLSKFLPHSILSRSFSNKVLLIRVNQVLLMKLLLNSTIKARQIIKIINNIKNQIIQTNLKTKWQTKISLTNVKNVVKKIFNTLLKSALFANIIETALEMKLGSILIVLVQRKLKLCSQKSLKQLNLKRIKLSKNKTYNRTKKLINLNSQKFQNSLHKKTNSHKFK